MHHHNVPSILGMLNWLWEVHVVSAWVTDAQCLKIKSCKNNALWYHVWSFCCDSNHENACTVFKEIATTDKENHREKTYIIQWKIKPSMPLLQIIVCLFICLLKCNFFQSLSGVKLFYHRIARLPMIFLAISQGESKWMLVVLIWTFVFLVV